MQPGRPPHHTSSLRNDDRSPASGSPPPAAGDGGTGVNSPSTQYVKFPAFVVGAARSAATANELCPGLVADALFGADKIPLTIPVAPGPAPDQYAPDVDELNFPAGADTASQYLPAGRVSA